MPALASSQSFPADSRHPVESQRIDSPLVSVLRFVFTIGRSLAAALEARNLYAELEYASDAELARRGITRDRIVQYIAATTLDNPPSDILADDGEAQLDLPFAA